MANMDESSPYIASADPPKSRDKADRAFPTTEKTKRKPGPKSLDEKTRKWLEARQKGLLVPLIVTDGEFEVNRGFLAVVRVSRD